MDNIFLTDGPLLEIENQFCFVKGDGKKGDLNYFPFKFIYFYQFETKMEALQALAEWPEAVFEVQVAEKHDPNSIIFIYLFETTDDHETFRARLNQHCDSFKAVRHG